MPFTTGGIEMNRRIACAVFGTSRSGKDCAISDATNILSQHGMKFTHTSPMSMIHRRLDGENLKNMSAEDKQSLVDAVRSEITTAIENGFTFVDEHYSFPTYYGGVILKNGYNNEELPFVPDVGEDGIQYEVVYDADWIKEYDLVVYMDINPQTILNRFRTSEGYEHNSSVTLDDISSWKEYEIRHIQNLCHNAHVPLFYIYNPEKSGSELAGVIRFFLKNPIGFQSIF